jgi:hypothetical protein
MTIEHDVDFYDTSALLVKGEDLFIEKEPFLISSVTLGELEKIKSATNKDADIKYAARQMLGLLAKYACADKYQIINHKVDNELAITEQGF